MGYINCRTRISRSDSGELDDALASITAPVSTLGGAGEIGSRLLGPIIKEEVPGEVSLPKTIS